MQDIMDEIIEGHKDNIDEIIQLVCVKPYNFLFVNTYSQRLFKSFDETDLQRRGYVNDYEITVNALMYLLAGHEAHHLNYIKENYLNE